MPLIGTNMKRALTPEEARDEKLAQLTAQNLWARRLLLANGDPRTVGDVASSVAAEFNDDSLMDELVLLAVRSPEEAGAKFRALVEKVLLADAETDALRDVEQMEQQREQDSEEASVDAHAWAIGRI